jgi:hypothetical protein
MFRESGEAPFAFLLFSAIVKREPFNKPNRKQGNDRKYQSFS